MILNQKVRSFLQHALSSPVDAPYQRSSYLTRLRSRKRILIYTDSRGINLPKHYYYAHYSTRLLKKYNVEAYLCPEKWTTILDFLKLWKKINSVKYEYVILHLGVVDASPRHQKIMINEIYPNKKEMFNEVFGVSQITRYHKSDFNCDYEGDKTINMYSLEMAREYLIPRLLEISGLIWIGTNKIDPSWRGNYWKDRPRNIKLVEEYSRLFIDSIPNAINLLDLWSLDDVRKYTFDNIHPNLNGSDIIFDTVESIININ